MAKKHVINSEQGIENFSKKNSYWVDMEYLTCAPMSISCHRIANLVMIKGLCHV